MPNYKKLQEDLQAILDESKNEDVSQPQQRKRMREEFDEVLKKEGITIKTDDDSEISPEELQKILKFLEEVEKINNSMLSEDERKLAIEGMMGEYGVIKLSIKTEGQPERVYNAAPQKLEQSLPTPTQAQNETPNPEVKKGATPTQAQDESPNVEVKKGAIQMEEGKLSFNSKMNEGWVLKEGSPPLKPGQQEMIETKMAASFKQLNEGFLESKAGKDFKMDDGMLARKDGKPMTMDDFDKYAAHINKNQQAVFDKNFKGSGVTVETTPIPLVAKGNAADNDKLADRKAEDPLPNSKNITKAVDSTKMDEMKNSAPTQTAKQSPDYGKGQDATARQQPQQEKQQESTQTNTNSPSPKH